MALRGWFSNLVVAVNAHAPVLLPGDDVPSHSYFHNLSRIEYGTVVNALQRDAILHWFSPLCAAGLSAGTFYMVVDDDATQQRYVPFL
ncbi:hypothetical protein DYB28_014062 [Aphanomyces astaci]|uniref:Uncharacterized protein n=1 Tax=Aphanomyces astaci TaxID=112090 RepID=A0A9X8DRV8_APHAT|nr:hypothetical protein DYB28_014062 [Aphanomyces astaci]